MKKIGIDLDGVGYAWDKTARFLIKHYWGVDFPPSQSSYSIKDNVPSHIYDWLWSAAVDKGLYRHGHMLKGYKEALDELSTIKGLHMAIITARPVKARVDTL